MSVQNQASAIPRKASKPNKPVWTPRVDAALLEVVGWLPLEESVALPEASEPVADLEQNQDYTRAP